MIVMKLASGSAPALLWAIHSSAFLVSVVSFS